VTTQGPKKSSKVHSKEAAPAGKQKASTDGSTRRRRPSHALVKDSSQSADVVALVRDLRAMIDTARGQVALAANAALTTLYWQIGHRVHTEVLESRRAEYGSRIVSAVGRRLEASYGRGFGEKSLHHMLRFAQTFPDAGIVSALRRQLSWSHFKQLIYIQDELTRTFYAEMCRIEG
jgi:hypothetical protein